MSGPVQIKGLLELNKALDGFSDRRMAAATATAMSRTASSLRAHLKLQMARHIDRPTPYTLNSLYVKGATADRLDARVFFKHDATTAATPATRYLLPQVEGGVRRPKRFELALQAMGALPQGWRVVPAAGAQVDSHGNVERGQVVQILLQLRAQVAAGKKTTSLRKAGGQFFVVPVGHGMAAGIYQRELIGANVTPVFVFVKSASYRMRFDFYGIGQQFVREQLPSELKRSIGEHIQRLAAQAKK